MVWSGRYRPLKPEQVLQYVLENYLQLFIAGPAPVQHGNLNEKDQVLREGWD